MPSIITHDTFGLEIYAELHELIGQSDDEKNAFLLGCQGPDVFFYGLLNPRTPYANKLGRKLHRSNCTEFLSALAMSVSLVDEKNAKKTAYNPSALEIARAYALGYLMHFELDSKVHPLVFSETYALCNAGVEGLNMGSQSEVHVEIECELDELVLTVKREQTISTFDVSTEALKASNRILNIIGVMFEYATAVSHSEKLPQNCYRLSVKAYRQTLRWLNSVTGVKRELIGRFETLFRQHSYLRAMIHKNVKLRESIFDNHEHRPWDDPWIAFTTHKTSFWDLYNEAIKQGRNHTRTYAKLIDSVAEKNIENLNEQEARAVLQEIFKTTLAITENKNFYGCDEKIADPETGKPRR